MSRWHFTPEKKAALHSAASSLGLKPVLREYQSLTRVFVHLGETGIEVGRLELANGVVTVEVRPPHDRLPIKTRRALLEKLRAAVVLRR